MKRDHDFVFTNPVDYSAADDILTIEEHSDLNKLRRDKQLSEDKKNQLIELEMKEADTNVVKDIIRRGNYSLDNMVEHAVREKKFAIDQYDRISSRLSIYFTMITIISTTIVSGLYIVNTLTDIFFQSGDNSWKYAIIVIVYMSTLLYFLLTSIFFTGVALLNNESSATFIPTNSLRVASWAVETLERIDSGSTEDKDNWSIEKEYAEKIRLYFLTRNIEHTTGTIIWSNNYLRTLIGTSFFQLTKALILLLLFFFSVMLNSLLSPHIGAWILLINSLVYLPILTTMKNDVPLIIKLLDMFRHGMIETNGTYRGRKQIKNNILSKK